MSKSKNLNAVYLYVLLNCWTIIGCENPASQEEQALDSQVLEMVLRSREKAQNGDWRIIQQKENWNSEQTAIIITDMWDEHWCESATQRVGELAPVMNKVVKEARKKGVMIIHAPSGTMAAYNEFAQRKRAKEIRHHEGPEGFELQKWCYLDPDLEAVLPIDDRDGGCDKPCSNGEPCVERSAWSGQISDIEIHDSDYISDDGQEIYNIVMEHGIENLILMGVHINMCVLGRPFGIRQLANLGKNVVLMRDMTDAMYNPDSEPFVTHFRGTELVTEHIEKYWAPTVLSSDLTGEVAFRFKEDSRTHIAMVIAEDQYKADLSLPAFAENHLSNGGHFAFNVIQSDGDTLIGLEQIRDADLVWLYVRRRHLPPAQLNHIRKHLEDGKPLLAMRTSSHAFETWKEFDAEVLGGNYQGHHPEDPETWAQVNVDQGKHVILEGITSQAFRVHSSLYKTRPLANDAVPLLIGRFGLEEEQEPVAWTRKHGNAKIFYTSLGHPRDFEVPEFNIMLLNALNWLEEEE